VAAPSPTLIPFSPGCRVLSFPARFQLMIGTEPSRSSGCSFSLFPLSGYSPLSALDPLLFTAFRDQPKVFLHHPSFQFLGPCFILLPSFSPHWFEWGVRLPPLRVPTVPLPVFFWSRVFFLPDEALPPRSASGFSVGCLFRVHYFFFSLFSRDVCPPS